MQDSIALLTDRAGLLPALRDAIGLGIVAPGIFLLVVTGLAGCASKQGAPETEPAAPRAKVPVVVAITRHADVQQTIMATGRTQIVRQEKLYAPIGGTLLSLRGNIGDRIAAGTVVARIRPKESQMQINGARALLATATTPEAKAEAERMIGLAASADNTADVNAPISGIVATRSANAGEVIAEGAEMLTLIDPSTTVFTADVPVSALPRLRTGMPCQVSLQAIPTVLDGVIQSVSPQSSGQSQTVQVRVRFTRLPQSILPALKSDINGTATIIMGVDRSALVVPNSALLRDDRDNSYTVVMVAGDSLAHVVPVEIGARNDSTTEIVKGALTDGMSVIVKGNYALDDSTGVTVTR